jgi:signal transduction histidine kinase
VTERIHAETALRENAKRLQDMTVELEETIDALRTQTEAAESARGEAENANRAKSEFLAVMSHELRTPLNAILGYEDLLDGEVAGSLNPTQHQYLQRIHLAAKQLLGLIDQILSLARIESGREEIDLQTLDLGEFAREVGDLVEPLATKKGLRFLVVAPEQPCRFETDIGKMRQILLNLLSNALKFTTEGECELAVTVENDQVLFTVRDTGRGIAETDLSRIFEPFTQVGVSRVAGGSGLGLSVSQRLTALLGGTITVQSTVGAGSTFVIRVPRTLALGSRVVS